MNDELHDEYSIDPNRVIVGGYSAGAMTSINAAYLNDYEELPPFLLDDYDDTGGLEGLSGNQGYDSSFNGIINLSGAVGNIDWIIEQDIPIVSMHGNLDDVVPYGNDLITLFGLNIEVDGSYVIHQRMIELGNYSELYTYENQGHNPYSDMIFETEFSSNFIYNIICPQYTLGDINLDQSINVLDIILLVNFILELDFPTSNQLYIADFNQDEMLNILDVVSILNQILD